MIKDNIFQIPEGTSKEELFNNLLKNENFRLERIISTGQASPTGFWYDGKSSEWVIVLEGSAVLFFEDDIEPIEMEKGDYILIPPHRRHRIDWTDPENPTVWLALHF
jgi:cupin 2 domain-containing protein